MLQKLADHIAEAAYNRPAEFKDFADQTSDETLRGHYLRLAKSWSYLAKSYTFVESLEQFLLDAHYKNHWVGSELPTVPSGQLLHALLLTATVLVISLERRRGLLAL